MGSGSSVLAFAALLGAGVWVGGFVALVVVAAAARRTLALLALAAALAA